MAKTLPETLTALTLNSQNGRRQHVTRAVLRGTIAQAERKRERDGDYF